MLDRELSNCTNVLGDHPPIVQMESSKDVNSILYRNSSLTQSRLDNLYRKPNAKKPSLSQRVRSQCYCSKRRLWKVLSTYLPVIRVIRYYKLKSYLLIDFLAGLTVGVMHIPQALGFGKLTSVKIVNGLYTSFWPVALYTIFGTSPHVSIGTSAVICILTAGIVDEQALIFAKDHFNSSFFHNSSAADWESIPEYMDFKEGVAMTTSLLAGLILLLMGVCRLGFITAYLSESFFSAFTSAAAVHIATSQISSMLGLSIKKYSGLFKIIYTYRDIFLNITKTNIAELIMSIICIIILLLVKSCINDRFKHKLKSPIPIELIVVILGTLVAYLANLAEIYDVKIVGLISTEIPVPKVPPLSNATDILLDSFIIAILIFANTIAMAKICAKKHNYEINDSQELIAYGLCNFVSAFFLCFPSSVAPPRSMIASTMGAKTTLHAVVTAILMFLLLSVISSLFKTLPVSILAAVIVIALKGLFLQIADLKKFWHINIFDFTIWLITFLSVVFLDIDYGLGIGIVISLLTVVLQSQLGPSYRIARLPKEHLLVEHKLYHSEEIRGVKIFRFEANIYFATAEIFRNSLYRKTLNPRKLLKQLQKLEKRLQEQNKKSSSTMDILKRSTSVDSESADTTIIGDQTFPFSVDKTIALDGSCKTQYSSVSHVTMNPSSTNVSNGEVPNGRKHSITQSSDSGIIWQEEETDPEDGGCYIPEGNLNIMKSVRFIILDLSSVNYIDATGANILSYIYKEYEHVNVEVFLAACHPRVCKSLQQAGVFDVFPPDNVFVTVNCAIAQTYNNYKIKSYDLKNFTDEEAAEDSYVTKL
ncbi:prestin [Octopus bimaculoides]|uniref:STAS domain-containing protein n=1 Tax=Octopus bimaculoides TaxID=37653 RepID=A0A0L8G720_OCTBM|nr:prestin [Octopus bimaculoides]XP_014783601.1 prestin [Octopus bimaculoides]XP_052825177.1 prestin [Octopus bimaculoides]|eukprot:XP_014783600.1 PREDICTED: prestin-like [Octopus bimaculoides]